MEDGTEIRDGGTKMVRWHGPGLYDHPSFNWGIEIIWLHRPKVDAQGFHTRQAHIDLCGRRFILDWSEFDRREAEHAERAA